MLRAILSGSLSIIIFSYLFYWLSYSKLELFKPIQSKVDTFNEKKKHKLKVITLILMIIIFPMILVMLNINMNTIIFGFVAGIIISFVDICFRDTFIEILKNDFKNE